MKYIIALLIALAFGGKTATDSTENPTEGTKVSSRISYGQEVPKNHYPYHVGLYLIKREKPYSWRCAGALISSTFVLTIASCTHKASKAIVLLGTTIFEDPAVSVYVSKENFIEHERYVQDGTNKNNIALIKIPRAKFGPDVGQIRMRIANITNSYTTGYGIISGYGKAGKDGTSPLKMAVMKLVKTKKCPSYKANFICAKSDNSTNIGTPDLGGPIVREDPIRNSLELIGIGVFVGTKKDPTIFLCIERYRNWIADHSGIEYTGYD